MVLVIVNALLDALAQTAGTYTDLLIRLCISAPTIDAKVCS